MSGYTIFIVEDDPWYGELLSYHLSLNSEYNVELYKTGRECLDNLSKKPDLICLDYGLPDMNGDELFSRIQSKNKSIPVIIISGQEEVSVAVSLFKAGVEDYILKDDESKDLLWNAILKIREKSQSTKTTGSQPVHSDNKYEFEKSIIGKSPSIQRTFALIEKAIKTDINVSITGETGTGKELVARAIHFNSARRKKAFVAVNMAAIPKDLVESELFGHEKGAFTGATSRKIGQFEAANGGTIFLDEIAELELQVQSKLLRVLQEREITRIGGNEEIKLDIRILSATHNNLLQEVEKGNFRQDLYFRIIGLPLEIPPLRERGKDIIILSRRFAVDFAKSNKLPPFNITQGALDKLMKYSFPGNVRELKAIIDLACIMSTESEITENDITFTAIKSEEQFLNEEKTLTEYNEDIINHFLEKYDNKVLLVAEKLNIGKSTIYKMLKEKNKLK